MHSLFEERGYNTVDFGQNADIVVVNTCTVTAMADKKSRAAIRRAARTGKVIVAGCLAQKLAEKLLNIDGVAAVIGTDDRSRIVEVAEQLLEGQSHIDLTHSLAGCGFEPMRISSSGEKTRGIIKVQEGCNCYCSYCIIPYVRGSSRSRPFADILAEAETLANQGVKELVLTGIHIASYQDGGRGLGDVITALDTIGPRIRIGSIEPGMLDENFVQQAAASSKLCPHFHLSLQSGSATVLQRMNRPYTPTEYLTFVTTLRERFDNPAITTDVISGFPAETEAEHDETMGFVKQIGFSRLHVFPYSSREGTRAHELTPKVPKAVSRRRAAELVALGEILEENYIHGQLGNNAQVLFEEDSKQFAGLFEGYSERYIRVAAYAEKNEIKTVRLSDVRGLTAFGE